jgi:redox-sensitive bicupin YhaK (pirin superfamily)
MKTIIHRAGDRGSTELGWLHSRHSFSFGRYFDPEKVGFGLLRVLNDDIVEPGEGFGQHPHDNMEIISIVLDGELQHKDSMGTGSVIKNGDVQVMSYSYG